VNGKRDLGKSETVIVHLSTNYLRTTIHLDFVMGEIYKLGYSKE
jgi:hypothetical protein